MLRSFGRGLQVMLHEPIHHRFLIHGTSKTRQQSATVCYTRRFLTQHANFGQRCCKFLNRYQKGYEDNNVRDNDAAGNYESGLICTSIIIITMMSLYFLR